MARYMHDGLVLIIEVPHREGLFKPVKPWWGVFKSQHEKFAINVYCPECPPEGYNHPPGEYNRPPGGTTAHSGVQPYICITKKDFLIQPFKVSSYI